MALYKHFSNLYLGFRLRLTHFDADSEAQTLSTRQKPKPAPDEAQNLKAVFEMPRTLPGLKIAK